jgi:hypothetical protein
MYVLVGELFHLFGFMAHHKPLIVKPSLLLLFQFLQRLVLILLLDHVVQLLFVKVLEDCLLFGLLAWVMPAATKLLWEGCT